MASIILGVGLLMAISFLAYLIYQSVKNNRLTKKVDRLNSEFVDKNTFSYKRYTFDLYRPKKEYAERLLELVESSDCIHANCSRHSTIILRESDGSVRRTVLFGRLNNKNYPLNMEERAILKMVKCYNYGNDMDKQVLDDMIQMHLKNKQEKDLINYDDNCSLFEEGGL